MNENDPFSGPEAEFILNSPNNADAADYIVTPPPPAYGIPADYLDTIRGRSLTVAAFTAGTRTPTFHRGLRAWGEAYQWAVKRGRDPYLWRVDVVTEEAWWRYCLLGARPNRVESYPIQLCWVEEEPATDLASPWPV